MIQPVVVWMAVCDRNAVFYAGGTWFEPDPRLQSSEMDKYWDLTYELLVLYEASDNESWNAVLNDLGNVAAELLQRLAPDAAPHHRSVHALWTAFISTYDAGQVVTNVMEFSLYHLIYIYRHRIERFVTSLLSCEARAEVDVEDAKRWLTSMTEYVNIIAIF